MDSPIRENRGRYDGIPNPQQNPWQLRARREARWAKLRSERQLLRRELSGQSSAKRSSQRRQKKPRALFAGRAEFGSVVQISGPFFVTEKIGAQIMFAFVREDRDHDVTGAKSLGHFERSAACRARRDPDQQTFLSRQAAGVGGGVFIAYGDHLVENLPVQYRRNEACADALNFVEARLSARYDG